MLARHELTPAQWEAIRDLLPGKPGDPGRQGKDNRLFVNAVIFWAKTGIPWRDLPSRFGEWNTVWKCYDRWCAAGVWERICQVLGDPDLEELQLDSTIVKAHVAACGGKRKASEKKRTLTTAAAWAVHAAD